MRGSGAYAVLIGARVFVESVIFASLAAVVHAFTAGRAPLPLIAATLVLFGAGLLLVSFMREVGTERRGSTIVVATMATAIAASLFLPMRQGADWFALLSRAVTFFLLAEAFLWRLLSIARGSTRWTDARNAVPVAGVAIAIAALWPETVDRGALPVLALLVVAASGLALSLARTNEELALLRGTVGTARASSATGVTVVVAIAAIVASLFAPAVQAAFGQLGDVLGPAAAQLLYWLVLPFAYLVGFLVESLRPLLSGWPTIQQIGPPRTPEEEQALLRQIEQTRPFVFGAAELIVVAIAALFLLLLVDRMLRERRVQLAPGVTLERDAIGGMSLLDTLRSMRPRRQRRARAPREDGSPATSLRVLYWRFLELAERTGAGWRAEHETPAEHERRLVGGAERWRGAEPIVRAFEDLRYGEIEPRPETVARARDALRDLEAPQRAS